MATARTHSDFQIGTEFFTDTGKWRCTDVGTRVIVAISLEPREMVRSNEGVRTPYMSHDPRDLEGPLYMVEENVFDEDSIEASYVGSVREPRVLGRDAGSFEVPVDFDAPMDITVSKDEAPPNDR